MNSIGDANSLGAEKYGARSSTSEEQRALPLGRVSTPEALEAAITDRVLGLEYPPGAPIREADVAGTYGVGRNSVRAALQSLVKAGLLRHAQNRGAFVPDFSLQDVRDLFDYRGALEGQAVRMICTNWKPLDAVDSALDRLRTAEQDADWTSLIELDLGLHRSFMIAAGGTRMINAYDGIVLELRLLLAHVQSYYPRPTSLLEEHHEILAALRDRDEHRSAEALRRHLNESSEQITAALSLSRQEG